MMHSNARIRYKYDDMCLSIVTTSEAKLTLEDEMLFAFVFLFTSLAFFQLSFKVGKGDYFSCYLCI